MGWNELALTRPSTVLADLPDRSYVYFTHAYAPPVTGDSVATTMHGEVFASVVERENVCGVQFHPEKSGDVGLTLLRTFLRQTGRS